MSLFLLGTLIAVVGCSMSALGLVLQKYSHEKNALSEAPVRFTRQPWWIAGLLVFLAGQILSLVAMGMVAQVVLSCLGGCSLIANAIFARVILGEKLLAKEVVGMVGVIVCMAVVIRCTPPSKDLSWDLHDMMAAFVAPRFLIAVAVLWSLLGALFSVSRLKPGLRPVFWALLSSVVGGYSVMLFKNMSLLGAAHASGKSTFWLEWQPLAMLLGGIGCGTGQVHTLNIALQLGEALVVVPIFYACGMLAQLLVGMTYFGELSDFASTTQLALFMCSIVGLFLFILLASGSKINGEVTEICDEAKDDQKSALLDPMGRRATAPGVMRKGTVSDQWVGKMSRLLSSGESPICVRRYASVDVPRVSSLDFDVFPKSFGENGRIYTVSVAGPLGIA